MSPKSRNCSDHAGFPLPVRPSRRHRRCDRIAVTVPAGGGRHRRLESEEGAAVSVARRDTMNSYSCAIPPCADLADPDNLIPCCLGRTAPWPAITKTHGKDTMQGRSAFRGRKNGRRYEPVGVLQSGYMSRWPLVPRPGVLIRVDQANVGDAEIALGVLIRNVRK